MIIYFSGTGNSQFVAELLGKKLSDEVVCSNDYIKNHLPGNFKSETPWVFVFPVYISTIAKIFSDFIKNSKFEGCKEAYFLATCAGSMGASPNYAKKICEKKNLNFMGAVKFVMPQNYIVYFKMNSPEECISKIKNTIPLIENISTNILERKPVDYKMASLMEELSIGPVEGLYNRFFTTTKKFYATDECFGCGICAKKCPLNNIKIENSKPIWINKICIHCMACINNCPKKAIEFGTNCLEKERYNCGMYKNSL